ncbi:DUF1800 domain-containing protein [Spirosoma arcticum]
MLRRVTFGPTQTEIASFTGLTAVQAVRQLITNSNYSPLSPVSIDSSASTTVGQPFLHKAYHSDSNGPYLTSIAYWWLALMTTQDKPPGLLDKLTLFWQNHFSVAREVVDEYRFVNRYLLLLRDNALGNFRTLIMEITKDPAVLLYLNGNENDKSKPNENYARALQELFTVGITTVDGAANYTEQDVKEAARVLTGWTHKNYAVAGSTSIESEFDGAKHDTANKFFSASYNNTIITGRASAPAGFATAGDAELADLVTMLLKHPQTPRFICRKLYRWYVNPNITPDIEANVIIPLAAYFASADNNYAVRPVIEKLLTSQSFFDDAAIGAIIKSPLEFVLGSCRFFNQSVPNMAADSAAFENYFEFVHNMMLSMQLEVLNQPNESGYEPYYQIGTSKTWISSSTLAVRNNFTDTLVDRVVEIKPGRRLGIDPLAWIMALQPNFNAVNAAPAITCEQVLSAFLANLFAISLLESQKDFLIDTVMMQNAPRTLWSVEWNAYRSAPADAAKKQAVTARLTTLIKFMLQMAEYQVF